MRKLGVALGALVALAGVVATPSPALADDDSATAIMTCERVEQPGRVRCEVEARVGSAESITWGDFVITKTPPSASALRGRIGPHDATVHEPALWRWALALVARDRGGGDVEGRVRLVVCKGRQCRPRELAVTAHLQVGE